MGPTNKQKRQRTCESCCSALRRSTRLAVLGEHAAGGVEDEARVVQAPRGVALRHRAAHQHHARSRGGRRQRGGAGRGVRARHRARHRAAQLFSIHRERGVVCADTRVAQPRSEACAGRVVPYGQFHISGSTTRRAPAAAASRTAAVAAAMLAALSLPVASWHNATLTGADGGGGGGTGGGKRAPGGSVDIVAVAGRTARDSTRAAGRSGASREARPPQAAVAASREATRTLIHGAAA